MLLRSLAEDEDGEVELRQAMHEQMREELLKEVLTAWRGLPALNRSRRTRRWLAARVAARVERRQWFGRGTVAHRHNGPGPAATCGFTT
eukprot:NODE_4584_length_659_cov_260.518212.p1 GENE.NODE_4584_length_659_cov_260.518212~~NODE_4584_length_659_cov_260.518212.p1  ORF type:complete len:103 (+),score=25.67 NODE_4584_length_659_cov_260.518212:44-310(+)